MLGRAAPSCMRCKRSVCVPSDSPRQISQALWTRAVFGCSHLELGRSLSSRILLCLASLAARREVCRSYMRDGGFYVCGAVKRGARVERRTVWNRECEVSRCKQPSNAMGLWGDTELLRWTTEEVARSRGGSAVHGSAAVGPAAASRSSTPWTPWAPCPRICLSTRSRWCRWGCPRGWVSMRAVQAGCRGALAAGFAARRRPPRTEALRFCRRRDS